MFTSRKIVAAFMLFAVSTVVAAQTDVTPGTEASEELKIAAVEALISAPPDRALPIVTKVLKGSGSTELKERALFVLSQIDRPEARALLAETARTGGDELRYEAIRTIGIGGDPDALAGLSDLYDGGDRRTKEAVLEALLIADDRDAVYRIAAAAQDPGDIEEAVKTLGAMGATEQLRALRNRGEASGALIEAYAVSGDTESLRELAMDGSDPERQAKAIEGLGIAGGDQVGEALAGIYRGTDSESVRDAVRDGLLIAGDDETLLQLFRESTDSAEKRKLLETLIMMDSDAVWDIVDATLENGQ